MLALDSRPGLLRLVCWMQAGRPRGGGGPRPRAAGAAGEAETGDGEPPDEEEFRRLFERYFPPVFRFFRNRGCPREECNDLTQETFLRVYRGFGGFRHAASFQTWLFQIATHLWCNEVRRRKADKREALEVPLDPAVERGLPSATAEDPAASTLAHERRRLLRQALDELPPQMQQCVLLYIDQNLKYREIAELMHISTETVKSQISQARQRLRKRLDAGLAGGG